MKQPNSQGVLSTSGPTAGRAMWRWRSVTCASSIAVLTLAFIQPLSSLMRYAIASEWNSYIPLVPFVSGYLLYLRRQSLPHAYRTAVVPSFIFATIAVVFVALASGFRDAVSVNDYLGALTFGYVSAVIALAFVFLGSKWMSAAAFPAAFLFFLVPLPDVAVRGFEQASVLASADVSAFFFRVTGTPLLREGTILALPGIVLRVAQECSGLHSSWILFITSLVASDLFLSTFWRRLVLVAFVLPLAIVRNSFRILVIGLLCVHVGPHMINSFVHSHGGPIFFALSLIPLFVLLLLLHRREARSSRRDSSL